MSSTITKTAMERIKEGIWDIHEGVSDGKKAEAPEQDNIMKGTLPRYKYIANLGQRYLLQKEFERLLAAHRSANERIRNVVTDDQFHAPKAAADLEFFGVDPSAVEALPSTRRMFAFFSDVAHERPDHLLAIHYVIEGSNNGAKYIGAAVRKAYGLEGTNGTWHLDPYGAELRPKWKAFGEAFNACGFSDRDLDEMILIGRMAFDHMNAIATESYAQPEGAAS